MIIAVGVITEKADHKPIFAPSSTMTTTGVATTPSQNGNNVFFEGQWEFFRTTLHFDRYADLLSCVITNQLGFPVTDGEKLITLDPTELFSSESPICLRGHVNRYIIGSGHRCNECLVIPGCRQIDRSRENS